VRLEGPQQRVELGADDGRDPADDAVELLVALLRGEEQEEIHGDVDVLRVARDAELEAAAGRFVDAALDDFAVDGVVARRDREVHDADLELALGLFLERAGVPGAGGHEDGALLGEEENGFVAAEAGVADLEVVGDLAEHLEPEGVGRVVEIEQAGLEGDEGLVVADEAVAVEVGAAEGAVGDGGEHHAVPVAEVVGRAGDGDVGLAGDGVDGGADPFADGEEFAVVARGFVAAGELLEQVLVVEDAHAEERERHGHVFLHFRDVGGLHAVLVGLAERQIGDVGARVVRVGRVDVAGEREEIAVVVGQPDVGRQHGADLHDVRRGAAHELGADPLAVGALGNRVLDDDDVRVRLLVLAGHLVDAFAHAGFELPVAEADDGGAGRRLLRAVGRDDPRRPQEDGEDDEQGEIGADEGERGFEEVRHG